MSTVPLSIISLFLACCVHSALADPLATDHRLNARETHETQNIDTHEQIRQFAQQFVISQIKVPELGKLEVTAANIDSRLNFAACHDAMSATIPGKQTLDKRVTLLITCDKENWQTYIPVDIRIVTPVVVATKPLARGARLAKNDLSIQWTNARLARGKPYSDINELIGAKVKRNINLSDPIQRHDICMVCKGDSVTMLTGNQNFTIVTNGVALTDGIMGSSVKVSNLSSNKVVDGKISAVGQVTINF
ncbi:MAG: flagellar basal body P-ring formation chaperone FlgA [Enterovibrio sp.]